MIGVVLCGGQSKRMGADKGLMKHNNEAWAQSAFSKLSALDIKAVLSVNRQQGEIYRHIFHPSLLITDSEKIQIKGPLCGVMSVHLSYPTEDLLVLACDMPNMEVGFLKQLIDHRRSDDSYDAWIFTNHGEPEPLCGIYSSGGLKKVLRIYNENKLAKHSMKFAIEQLHSFFIPVKIGEEKFFMNINAHSELNGF